MIYFLIGYSIGLFGAIVAISKKFLELQETVIELQKESSSKDELTMELLRVYVELRREMLK